MRRRPYSHGANRMLSQRMLLFCLENDQRAVLGGKAIGVLLSNVGPCCLQLFHSSTAGDPVEWYWRQQQQQEHEHRIRFLLLSVPERSAMLSPEMTSTRKAL